MMLVEIPGRAFAGAVLVVDEDTGFASIRRVASHAGDDTGSGLDVEITFRFSNAEECERVIGFLLDARDWLVAQTIARQVVERGLPGGPAGVHAECAPRSSGEAPALAGRPARATGCTSAQHDAIDCAAAGPPPAGWCAWCTAAAESLHDELYDETGELSAPVSLEDTLERLRSTD